MELDKENQYNWDHVNLYLDLFLKINNHQYTLIIILVIPKIRCTLEYVDRNMLMRMKIKDFKMFK
jgi:hypothetical protein